MKMKRVPKSKSEC